MWFLLGRPGRWAKSMTARVHGLVHVRPEYDGRLHALQVQAVKLGQPPGGTLYLGKQLLQPGLAKVQAKHVRHGMQGDCCVWRTRRTGHLSGAGTC